MNELTAIGLVDSVVSLWYHSGMSNPITKYDNAPALYASGLSIGDCAAYFNITRQAMWLILKRRGVAFRKQLKYGKENHWFRGGGKSSKRATHMVETAIRKGIVTPKPCEICGGIGQAHHDDYNKPLDVRWLCQIHHHEWHKHNHAIPLAKPLPVMSHPEIVKLSHTPESNKKRWQSRRANEKGKSE